MTAANNTDRITTFAQAEQFIENLEASSTRLSTPCGDGELVWRQFGQRVGGTPTLVLLHGGSGSWTHWVLNVEFFAQTRRVLTVDLPGLGDSDLPHRAESAEVLAEVICVGLERILEPTETFDLVGFSFGGILSGHVGRANARSHSFINHSRRACLRLAVERDRSTRSFPCRNRTRLKTYATFMNTT